MSSEQESQTRRGSAPGDMGWGLETELKREAGEWIGKNGRRKSERR